MELCVAEKSLSPTAHHPDSNAENITQNPDNPTYMFTEEQIAKQLVDMKEQTEFMKKFRGALGVALQEIQTLRTTLSTHSPNGTESKPFTEDADCDSKAETNKAEIGQATFGPCAGIAVLSNVAEQESVSRTADDTAKLSESQNTRSCVCSQFDNIDVALLKEVLEKMGPSASKENINDKNRITSAANRNLPAITRAKVDAEKLQQASEAFANFIRRVDAMKSVVADRNSTVMRLCKELTEARIVRVKREKKLEQKLEEVKEWKGKYEQAKKMSEKQIKISKGLRVALNAERQRVKSSEKMQASLEETRLAFDSLKTQAGQLMSTLEDKDSEIVELNAKIQELEQAQLAWSRSPQKTVSSAEVHGSVKSEHFEPCTTGTISAATQTESSHCESCANRNRALANYDQRGIYDGRNHASQKIQPVDSGRVTSPYYPHRGMYGPPSGHPYGRVGARIYAPYTSPESYRRVSRPPLRRRLHYDPGPARAVTSSNPETNRTTQPNYPHQPPQPPPDTDNVLLSPIDETDECARDDVTNLNKSPVTMTPDHPIDMKGAQPFYPQGDGFTDPENPMAASGDDAHDHRDHGTTFTNAHEISWKAHERSPIMNMAVHNNHAHGHSSNKPTVSDRPVECPQHEYKNNVKSALENSPHDLVNTGEPIVAHDGHAFGALHGSAMSPSNHIDFNKPVSHHDSASISQEENAHHIPQLGSSDSESQNSPVKLVKTGLNQPEPTKASYLEVGRSSTPSPSDSRHSSVELHNDLGHPQQNLTFNSIIRPGNGTSSASQMSTPTESHSPTVSFSPETYSAPLSPEPQQFGVIWHPELMKQHANHANLNDSLDDASSISSEHSEGSVGAVPKRTPDRLLKYSESPTTPNQRARSHRSKKTHHESRYVMYKGHPIDVTKFSIHAFRDIVWTLEGGPESADDFIKFLSSLARKLNASPKWAGRHAMGDPNDWLALRGLF